MSKSNAKQPIDSAQTDNGVGVDCRPMPCSGRDGEDQSRRGGAVTGAHNCDGCRGCQYTDAHAGGWCHMFANAPGNLPCAQHDCFKVEREMTTEILRRNPALFTAMVMGATDDQNK